MKYFREKQLLKKLMDGWIASLVYNKEIGFFDGLNYLPLLHPLNTGFAFGYLGTYYVLLRLIVYYFKNIECNSSIVCYLNKSPFK